MITMIVNWEGTKILLQTIHNYNYNIFLYFSVTIELSNVMEKNRIEKVSKVSFKFSIFKNR